MARTNSVRQIRESKMMSKAELARKADVTVQTIDRIEKGNECRLDTKRKIILALGYKLADRTRIFEDGDVSTQDLPKKSGRKKA
ncbi:MAG: helix-turn-helix transcriptional regulator [Nitrospinota bacterium]